MDGLTIREATEADMPRIAELVAGDPGQEAIGLIGGHARALKFGMAFALLPSDPPSWRDTAIAESQGRVVGVLQTGVRSEEFKITPALVWLAVRSFGFSILGLIARAKARQRVQPDIPPGTYHIAELHTDPALRGQGIGGSLLDYAEEQARERGFRQMSLSTTTANPARRLYERHGFRIVEVKTDAEYEELTGIEGRILMLKDLA